MASGCRRHRSELGLRETLGFDRTKISGWIRRVTRPFDLIGSVCWWDRDHVPGEAKYLGWDAIECSSQFRLWRSQCRKKDGDAPVTTLCSCRLQDRGSRPGNARAKRNDECGEQEPASQRGWPDFDEIVRPCSEENHLPSLPLAFWMAHLKPIPYSSSGHPGTGAFRIRSQVGWMCRHIRQINGRVRLVHSPCTRSFSLHQVLVRLRRTRPPRHFADRPTARSVTLERATARVEQTAFREPARARDGRPARGGGAEAGELVRHRNTGVVVRGSDRPVVQTHGCLARP
jgi:hypothetical protein